MAKVCNRAGSVAVSSVDAKAAKEAFPIYHCDKQTRHDCGTDDHAKRRTLRAAASTIDIAAGGNSFLARSQKTSVRKIDRITVRDLMKNVPHSLASSVTATTLIIASYIVFLVGFAWLVRADIVLLK